ncbi:large ribosomal subunit protein uL22m-like [Amphiura filiformis]|uniref:large ribosomal subunit protein uL22m-like n=1 Tax=Amphiura filiformis TaxID=82378 RepID=UPI003B211003
MASSCIHTLQCRFSGIHRLLTIATNTQQTCLAKYPTQIPSLYHPRINLQRLAGPVWSVAGIRSLHTSDNLHRKKDIRQYELKNQTIYPPQKPGEPRRPAEVYYAKRQIKHSQRKLWYIAEFVKGMMIDDALSQLPLIKKKGAIIVRDVLLEAQKEAMENHNVEYKSNLHIAESLVGKGKHDHAIRYHGRGFKFLLDLSYCHYYVCLREGPPPEKPVFTGYDQAERYMNKLRYRYIKQGL